jgi:hypothetical protein
MYCFDATLTLRAHFVIGQIQARAFGLFATDAVWRLRCKAMMRQGY